MDKSIEKLTHEIKTLKELVKKLLPKERKIEWLTIGEVSKHLKISRQTLKNWTAKGELKSYVIGGRIFYKLHELDEAPQPQKFRNFNYDA